MSLLNRLERSLERFAIPNLTLYLVGGQVLFWGVSYLGTFELERIALLPAAVMAGEVWRLLTFLWLPPNSHPVFIAFAWYMFYLMGGALEGHWGVFRFNLYIFIGWLFTVLAAFLVPGAYSTNLFLAGSVFLAFAHLNPEFELMIFFILPLKIKWLALIQWLFYGYALIFGSWPVRLAVLASIGNYLCFFARDIVRRAKTGRRQMEFRAQQAAAQCEEPAHRHRCVICGKTDLSHPQMDFRYCSKCAHDECYCSEHLGNHAHTLPRPSDP